jgi:uncharacterized SAM-binding protein YcdF (DUF218 family)
VRSVEHGGIFFSFMGLLALLAILAFLFLVRHPLLRLAGSFWVVDEPAEHADVIIVLGDDNYEGDRAARAAALFHEGLSPQVVASGRLLRPYASTAEMIAHDLEEHGVPEASVIKFSSRAADTREEAVALRGLVVSHGWKRVVVVTSNYHTRRARFICQRVFPRGISVRIASAPDSDFDPSHWWQTRLGQKIFLNEVLGYVVARWELRHRYVPVSSPPPEAILQPARWRAEGNRGWVTLPYLIGNNLDLQIFVSVL